MNVGRDTYERAGLRGVADLYELLPSKLRAVMIRRQGQLWTQLWQELSSQQQQEVNAYVIEGEDSKHAEELGLYETRLRDLESTYAARRAERVREVTGLAPDLATALLVDFEKAYEQLLRITRELLAEGYSQRDRSIKRLEEAEVFAVPTEAIFAELGGEFELVALDR